MIILSLNDYQKINKKCEPETVCSEFTARFSEFFPEPIHYLLLVLRVHFFPLPS